uniref:CRAL-TRIO domain-containing protein n=1 Tax=Panagrolaimus davidi TaxID=227884 RepID=A0A914QF60_9BILA
MRCNSNVMKAICSKIYYNSITSLSLYYTTLKISDYEILTSSKILIYVFVQGCNILDNDENEISLDKIFEQTPNVEKFAFDTYGVPDGLTNKIMENMTAVLKGNYVKYFSVKGFVFSPNFVPNLLCAFIKKAAAPNAEFRFLNCMGFDKQYFQIKKAVDEMIEEWDISDHQKPVIEIFS